MKALLSPFLRAALGAAALGFAAAACCAATAGHPTPDAATLLTPKAPIEMSRSGKVVSRIDASEYTYAEVNENGKKFWLAAPRTEIKEGDNVRYPDGAVMVNFYSKLLQRTFPSIIFVDAIEVTKAR